MQPGDPVVGGTVLRRVAIQSPNFVHLVSGWSINQDGSAEFNGLTINGGDVILTDGSGNVVGTLDGSAGLVLVGNGTLADPEFQITPFSDMLWAGSTPTQTQDTSIEVGTIVDDQTETRIAMILSSGKDNGQAQAMLAVAAAPADGSEPPVVVTGNGTLLVGSDPAGPSGQAVPESWHAMTLVNSWTHASAFDVPSYRMTAEGKVDLKGVASGGTHTSGTLVATLPVGYRPTVQRQLVASADGNVSPFCCVLHVATNGQITMFEGTSTADVIGFDGLSFYLS
jgi:hypothetical protein